MNKLILLILIALFAVVVSCTGDLKPLYRFENGKGQTAVILSSNFHYYWAFIDDKNKIDSKFKVGVGVMDSGISSAMWDKSETRFALKICGEGQSVYIYTYDLKEKKLRKYVNPKPEQIPGWISFSTKAGFDLPEDIDIDRFKVR
jgi:hypothetical protein